MTPSAVPPSTPTAGGAFQDHDDRLGDSSRVNGRSHLVHEGSGCSCSVPPPPVGRDPITLAASMRSTAPV